MSQRSDLLGVCAALNAAGVEYAVVGGVAVGAHGFVRATRDLDLFLRPTEENAKLAFAALRSLDAPLEGLDHTDLLVDYEHFRLETESSRLDLLTSIGTMSFDQVWRNRIEAQIDAVRVPFISKEDLIENKLQVGRLQNLADVEQLRAVSEGELSIVLDLTNEDT